MHHETIFVQNKRLQAVIWGLLSLPILLLVVACNQSDRVLPTAIPTVPAPEYTAVTATSPAPTNHPPTPSTIDLPPTLDLSQQTTPIPESQPTAVSTTAAPVPDNLRRPNYQIEVALDYAGRTAHITQTVTLTNNSPDHWSFLIFHAAPAHWPGFFELEQVTLTTTTIPVAITPVINNTMIHLPLSNPLLAGETAQVQFRYHLSLPRLDSLGWGPVGNAGWSPELIQMGDWYPSLVPYDAAAGRWQTWQYVPVGDPVRNELADFEVAITTDTNVVIAAPGYLSTIGDTRTYRLENGRAFAFLASPHYTTIEGYSQNTPVRVYVLGRNLSLAPIVLNTAVQSMNLFLNRFGPYPHDELIIAENGFLTAMEYSAIISLSGFAFREYNNSPRSLLTPITAHEVAHQWWYSAVGNDQVLEPWLDEALCMFAELLYFEAYHPDDVAWWWQYRVHRWRPTGYVDATIYDFDNSPDFVHDMYSQAAYFMRDLRAEMGEANFNSFLRAYYHQYQNQIATADDFFALAQSYSNSDLTPLVGRYFATLPSVLSIP